MTADRWRTYPARGGNGWTAPRWATDDDVDDAARARADLDALCAPPDPLDRARGVLPYAPARHRKITAAPTPVAPRAGEEWCREWPSITVDPRVLAVAAKALELIGDDLGRAAPRKVRWSAAAPLIGTFAVGKWEGGFVRPEDPASLWVRIARDPKETWAVARLGGVIAHEAFHADQVRSLGYDGAVAMCAGTREAEARKYAEWFFTRHSGKLAVAHQAVTRAGARRAGAGRRGDGDATI